MSRTAVLTGLILLISLPSAEADALVKKPQGIAGKRQVKESQAVVGLATHDVGIVEIVSPAGFITAGTYAPVVKVGNFGAATERNFAVSLRITGGYYHWRAVDSLMPGETLALTFSDWAVSQIGTYELECSTSVANDSNRGNDRGYSLAAIPNWRLDFETDSGGLEPEPANQAWTWGIPAPPRPGAHSGTRLWAAPLTDSYPRFAVWRLKSPGFVALQNEPVIGFWHWYDYEYTYDGGNLKYSTDNGLTWEQIYPWEPYAQDYDRYVEGLNFEDGYTGNDRQWRLAWFRIPVGAGEPFWLRWDCGTDRNINFSGWMIDDLAGVGCVRPARDVGVSSIRSPAGVVAPGVYLPAAVVRNYGTSAVGSFDVHFSITNGYHSIRNVPALLPNESLQLTFNSWTVSDTGIYFLKCSTALTGDQNPADDFAPGLSMIPHGFADFEANNGGLVCDSFASGWRWGTPAPGRGTHSGLKVWGAPLADSYPPNAAWWLRTPLLVSTQDNPVVHFWHRYEFEPWIDHGQCYYFLSGAQPELLYPWEPYSRKYDDDYGYCLRDKEWRPAWFQIPVAARSLVRLDWYLESDIADNFSGWLLDDLAWAGLRWPRNRDVALRQLYVPEDTILVESQQPSAQVINLGYSTQSFLVALRILDSTGSQLYADSLMVDTLSSGAMRDLTFRVWSGPPAVGRYTALAYTKLAGDSVPENDTIRRTVYAVPPAPELFEPENGTTVYTGYPLFRWLTVPNTNRFDIQVYGTSPAYTDTFINRTHLTQPFFVSDTFLPLGDYRWRVRAWIGGYGSRWSAEHYFATEPPVDVGVAAILAPQGVVDTEAVIIPQARVANYTAHTLSFPVQFRIDSAGGNVYVRTVQVNNLAPGTQQTVVFPLWPRPHPVGDYSLRCSTMLAGDSNPVNDFVTGTFRIVLPDTGWVRRADVPAGAKNKYVTLGGALAGVKTDGRDEADLSGVYCFKGNGRCEFYQYNTSDNSWLTKESIPAVGRSGKKKTVKKGASLCAVRGKVFATKGGNTLEFWCYDPQATGYPWRQLADVPAGEKNIKEGCGMSAVVIRDTAWVYLLKGSGTEEFYRYNTVKDSWYVLPDAPDGESGKPYKNGSGITYNPEANLIYALKNYTNEFFRYFVDSNFWRERASLPIIGASGKKKRVGSGAGIAFLNGAAYALKGQNTLEFWCYVPETDQWRQLSDMPVGGGKRVKGGGALTATDNMLYALKGNNTLEFYQYRPSTAVNHRLLSDNNLLVTEGVLQPIALRIQPNPVNGAAAVSYCLPGASRISLKLYDISGRLVMTLRNAFQPAGEHSLSIAPAALPAGIYLLQLRTDALSITRKLVIE